MFFGNYRSNERLYVHIKTFYSYVFSPIVGICTRTNLHSNIFSFIVFFCTGIFVYLLFAHQVSQAGAMGFIIAIADILGSLVSSIEDRNTPRRALLDSIIDRYSEILLYTGMIVFFLQLDEFLFGLFAYLALIGALMSSFIRLRADQFGLDANYGFIQRPERIFLLSSGMFFGLTGAGIAALVVALISNITASYQISRLWFNKK